MNDLKRQVFVANMQLTKHGLVTFTWGNVSGIDREKGVVIIKPSGVEYSRMALNDMVTLNVDGEITCGDLTPSSDTPTHLELYRRFPNVGGIVHTHSRWATIFAQMMRPIPPFGTTHADYFYGEIPCTPLMSEADVNGEYERNTGKIIADTFEAAGINPDEIPAVLVSGHAPFIWGKDPNDAVHNAVVLEEIAFMAWHMIAANDNAAPLQKALLDKHYLRKHGENAYYGQGKA